MYPDSGYKLAHAQSVCTRPFSPRWEGPGDEAKKTRIANIHPYPSYVCPITQRVSIVSPVTVMKCALNGYLSVIMNIKNLTE